MKRLVLLTKVSKNILVFSWLKSEPYAHVQIVRYSTRDLLNKFHLVKVYLSHFFIILISGVRIYYRDNSRQVKLIGGIMAVVT